MTLQFEYKDHNDLSLQPNDRLINPLYFIVKGKESYRSELSGESLKNTLLTAYKDGAKDNGLDAWAESVLMVSPYKKNENDGTNPWIIVPLVLTIFFGFSIFGFGFFKAFSGSGGTLFGLFFFSLLAMVISILGGIGLWRSFFGTKFKRLEPIDKIAVIIALIPGYFFALIISGGLIFVVLAIFAAIGGVKREDRISEIEEGVRRGLL